MMAAPPRACFGTCHAGGASALSVPFRIDIPKRRCLICAGAWRPPVAGKETVEDDSQGVPQARAARARWLGRPITTAQGRGAA